MGGSGEATNGDSSGNNDMFTFESASHSSDMRVSPEAQLTRAIQAVCSGIALEPTWQHSAERDFGD